MVKYILKIKKRIEHDRIKDNFLNKNGWNIYRIKFDENNQNTINNFLNFINYIIPNSKKLENRIYKYSELKKNKIIVLKNNCPKCGNLKYKNAELCSVCRGFIKRKVSRPSKEILEKDIQENSFVALGKKYGVSDNAIRKWCKAYGIKIIKRKKTTIEKPKIRYKTIEYNGEIHSIREWSKITGISEWTIRHRLDKGMSPENILKKQ